MISDFKKISILLIEDEEFDVRRVRNTIKPFADRILIEDIVADGTSALALIQSHPDQYDVIIMDYQIAGGVSGEDLILAIKRQSPAVQIIVITKMTINITDFSFANRLIEAGAMWYCTKYPGDIEEYIYQPTDFILNIFNAMQKKQLELEKQDNLRSLDHKIGEILAGKELIGQSPNILRLKELIKNYANHDTSVLITGYSGTGKELVANRIHYLSSRRNEKFVPINCGSLPSQLIESELFGYEKGAFTGANTNKLGLFEVANNGTVFLDEVSELPADAQVKLLRFLQEGEIDKIGRTKNIKVNVRIISATNKNLLEEIKQKRFREDLYYRLNVATITVPSLFDRSDDIEEITQYFLKRYAQQMNVEIPQLTEDTIELMRQFEWPGNIRQLQNVVQRYLLSGLEIIKAEDAIEFLGINKKTDKTDPSNIEISDQFDRIASLKEMEREFRLKYFQFVRKKTSSDSEAARLLGLAPPNYYRMCKELGLK